MQQTRIFSRAVVAVALIGAVFTFNARYAKAATLFDAPESEFHDRISAAVGCHWSKPSGADHQQCVGSGLRAYAADRSPGYNGMVLNYLIPDGLPLRYERAWTRVRANAKKIIKAFLPEWRHADAWLEASMKRCDKGGTCVAIAYVSSLWVAIEWNGTNAGEHGANFVTIADNYRNLLSGKVNTVSRQFGLINGSNEDLRDKFSAAFGCAWVGEPDLYDSIRQVCGPERGLGAFELISPDSSDEVVSIGYANPFDSQPRESTRAAQRARADSKKMVKMLLPEWKQADAWLEASMKSSERGEFESTMFVPPLWVSVKHMATVDGERSNTIVSVGFEDSFPLKKAESE